MNLAARLSSRGDLTSFLMQLSAEVGADAYMLLAILHDQDRNLARIVASNWIHDAIELAGHSLIAALAQAPTAAAPGTRPRSMLAAAAPALPELGGEEAKLLDVLGHREIFSLRLAVGSRRYFLLLSSAEAGKIAADALTAAQFKCCYALSQVPGTARGRGHAEPALRSRARMPDLGFRRQDHRRGGADPRRLLQHRQQLPHPRDPEAGGQQPRHGDRHCHQERHHLRKAEVKEAAQALFSPQRNPFGAFSIGSETHHTVTIPDAVRRCRWIAVDLNASAFAVFFASPSSERERLVPCFDSSYPATSAETRLMAGEQGLGDRQACPRLDGALLVERRSGLRILACPGEARLVPENAPLAAGTCGLAFPVQAERGRCGIVAFLGADIALQEDGLFAIHARCFTLFEALARIRPGESAKFPSISKREIECLKLTANGYTSEDIARLLKLSVHTANQYLSNTTQKLNAVNRMHAVAKALRMGLIE